MRSKQVQERGREATGGRSFLKVSRKAKPGLIKRRKEGDSRGRQERGNEGRKEHRGFQGIPGRTVDAGEGAGSRCKIKVESTD